MKIVSYREFRQNLKKYLDSATNKKKAFIMRRSNGRDTVFICAEEYEKLKEFYETFNPKKK